jgi:hypothetical protein
MAERLADILEDTDDPEAAVVLLASIGVTLDAQARTAHRAGVRRR